MNDEHCGSAFVCHPFVLALVGKVKQKLAPRGKLSAAHKRPPCASTMERLIDNPMPVPSSFVVKKGSKTLSACCGGSPTPVSLTHTMSSSSSARCALMASSRFPSTSFIAATL